METTSAKLEYVTGGTSGITVSTAPSSSMMTEVDSRHQRFPLPIPRICIRSQNSVICFLVLKGSFFPTAPCRDTKSRGNSTQIHDFRPLSTELDILVFITCIQFVLSLPLYCPDEWIGMVCKTSSSFSGLQISIDGAPPLYSINIS